MDILIKILKTLNTYRLDSHMMYDRETEMMYVDLNTQAKSHIKIYEDLTVQGRYDYFKESIYITSESTEGDIIDCCLYLVEKAMCGREFVNIHWMDLARLFNHPLKY